MVNEVDVYVGKRIRHRRWILGMSQEELADSVGVKFQQIQKYETGGNRVSASRLWEIANCLNVGVEHFFRGFESSDERVNALRDTVFDDYRVTSFVADYYKIPKERRKAIFNLAVALAAPESLDPT